MSKAIARKDADTPEYGPAMLALRTERQRVFCMMFIILGNGAEAARRAGYCTPASTAETFAKTAYQLLQNDSIRSALAEECRRWFRAAAPAAVATYHRILSDDKARDVDRLRAADAVMARADPITTGHVVQVDHHHEHRHRHHLSAGQVTQRILELAAKAGVDLAKLPPVIDAAAEEVT
jgi:phage terminase small subunit